MNLVSAVALAPPKRITERYISKSIFIIQKYLPTTTKSKSVTDDEMFGGGLAPPMFLFGVAIRVFWLRAIFLFNTFLKDFEIILNLM
jgi:hypothetical protein